MSVELYTKESMLNDVFKELKSIRAKLALTKRRMGKNPKPWHSIYLSESRYSPWVAICWSDLFEDTFPKESTPFWIEMHSVPSKTFKEKGFDKINKTYQQPEIEKDRLIIPVSIKEMIIPFEVAKKVYKIAEEVLK